MNNKNFSLDAILEHLSIKQLNPMQEASIEANLQHNEVILRSATGSGKTIGYLLPLLNLYNPEIPTTQSLIVVPSRELAQQIELVFKQMGTGLKITACYGGHLRETEENNLKQAPAIIVGTPGRLCDHIRRNNITIASINTLVLDEYDKSLELGFEEEMEFIVTALPHLHHKILTSATQDIEIPSFLALKEPLKLNFIDPDAPVAPRLTIQSILSDARDKADTLFKLVCYLNGRPSIIFCNHRESVERAHHYLQERGITAEFYHGGMEQQERDSALCKFRNGTTNILVTTDLAARGLDIPHIRYIIHYHLPPTEDIFIHRNGRTARVEASGTAILMLNGEEHIPPFITEPVEAITLPDNLQIPEKPKWTTLFIAAGKKDKVNKIDIVGFLGNKGQLKKDDIGLIEVKDFFSFVAIRKNHASNVLQLIKNEKIKNKKVRIEVAK